MAKHSRQERERKRRFIMIYHDMVMTEAWKSLTPQQVRVLLLLIERYNGSNNGRIALSVRDASRICKISQATATKSLRRLIEVGFIKRVFVGSYTQKSPKASEYELTHVKRDKNKPSVEFRTWKPEKKTVPNKVQGGINLGAISNEHVV